MTAKSKHNAAVDFDRADQVLEQLPTPVMAVSKELKVTFINAAGREMLGKSQGELVGKNCYDLFKSKHCNTPDCCLLKAMRDGKSYSARNEAVMGGTRLPFEYFAAPLRDAEGNITGGLEYILDLTERERYESQLREQATTIRKISTPAIQLWDGIVMLPVVGIVDSARAQQMMDVILAKIAETACKVMVIDIQGVPAVDTAVGNHFIKIVKAARLMGCHPIISGISPAVAQTIVNLGIDMGAKTTATLRDALTVAFEMLNCEVRPARPAGRG